MDKEVIIKVENVKKTFNIGTQIIEVLKGISFEIYKGDFVVIFGPSGCGKSTLLHGILGLERPTDGVISFFGEDIYADPSEDWRSIFRKKHIGMVYQQANWIKSLNVRENVAFPLMLMRVDKNEAYQRAVKGLIDVGMGNWSEYVPTELSSGQQQRVSMVRALINDPEIIVADEPTGNLDYLSGIALMEMLQQFTQEKQKTVIMVTHDLEYLKYANRVVKILDGKLEGVFEGEEKERIASNVYSKRGVHEAKEAPVVSQENSDKRSEVSETNTQSDNFEQPKTTKAKRQKVNSGVSQ
jgi:putative ABC transport system ATP-binding protein